MKRNKYLHFSIYITGALILLAFAVACSSESSEHMPAFGADIGDTGPSSIEDIIENDDATHVAQLLLSPNPVEAVVTQTIQMSFRAYDGSGLQLEEQSVIWRIADTQIATVDESGLLRALQAGQTTLVATSGDVQASVQVDILPIDTVDRIEIIPEQREIGVGQSLELGIKGYRSDDTEIENLNLPIEWQSNASETASINAGGTLAGVKRGPVGISASVGELEAQANYRVELKFDTIECGWAGCLAISTEGNIYEVFFGGHRDYNEADNVQNNDGVWMPQFSRIEVENDVRFKSAHGRGAGVGNTTCALSTEGRVYCWGANNLGMLGVDFQTSSLEMPTALDTELRFKALRLGRYTSCALTIDGSLYCWGDLLISGKWIERGLDLYETHSSQPVLIDEGPFEQLMMTATSVCVQGQKSQIWHCMGSNGGGQLGHGEPGYQDDLVEVAAPGAFTAVSAFYSPVYCGIGMEKQVWCWGTGMYGSFGQPLGSGIGYSSFAPKRTAWEVPMVDITALSGGFCGVTLERDIRCWGNNSGCGLGQQAPGRGQTDYRYDPQPPIAGVPEDWKDLSGRCVLTEGGDIWCWGLKRATGDPVWPTACEPTTQRILTF